MADARLDAAETSTARVWETGLPFALGCGPRRRLTTHAPSRRRPE
jgi:hypothetical protein